MSDDNISTLSELDSATKEIIGKNHAMETRVQTIGMVLIVGFLTWVGSGLVDVKVGLAQMLTESGHLSQTLRRQSEQLVVIESDITQMQIDLRQYVTREELKDILQNQK
jgi:hypothetical protein|tara:strand:+ start:184 stop:510 length:327 start_codon:yes stop_codon:yes gene_type:complete